DNLGIICENELSVVGTFTQGAQPLPDGADPTDCYDVGEWRLTATVSSRGCEVAAGTVEEFDLSGEFAYESIRDIEDTTQVTFLNSPGAERANLKVNEDGGGCVGKFEHFGSNPSWTSLSLEVVLPPPARNPGEVVTLENGLGTFRVHVIDAYPLADE
ncbi:MAG: hypothetical protein AAGC55_08135, partial [Myxococcota bacterium]